MKGAKPSNVTRLPMAGDSDQVKVPEPPENMTEDAAHVWQELAPILTRQDRLLVQFRPMFRVWCEAFADYQKFTYDLQIEGDYFSTQTRNGKQEKKRAAWGQRQEAIANMTRIGALFGLSPVDDQRFDNGGQGDLLAKLAKALDGPA